MGKVRQRRRGSSFPAEVEAEAQRQYVVEGRSSGDIARRLARQYPDYAPSDRTVRNWVRRWDRDSSGEWALEEAESGLAAAVLRVLPGLFAAAPTQAASITRNESEVLGRLALAFPDMPANAMYLWTRLYLGAKGEGDGVGDLLAYLGFTPWRDGGARYRDADDAGTVSTVYALALEERWWAGGDRKDRHDGTLNAAAVIAPGPVTPQPDAPRGRRGRRAADDGGASPTSS